MPVFTSEPQSLDRFTTDSIRNLIAGCSLEHMTANEIVDVVGEFRLQFGSKASDRILPIAKLPLLFLKEELGGSHSENSRDLPEYRGRGKFGTALNLADVIGR